MENERKCPVCGEDVKLGATQCQSCGSDITTETRNASEHQQIDENKIASSANTHITELKEAINISTTKFVLLTIVTVGVFPILWLYRYQPVINKITKSEIATDVYLICITVCYSLSNFLYTDSEDFGDVIAELLDFGFIILFIVWAFKAKKALQDYALNEFKLDLRMNAFYTFIFTVFYINYCINDLPQAKRRQDILNGKNN